MAARIQALLQRPALLPPCRCPMDLVLFCFPVQNQNQQNKTNKRPYNLLLLRALLKEKVFLLFPTQANCRGCGF